MLERSMSPKTVIAVYPGRFQPMGLHHKLTYDWMVSTFGYDNSFITTSSKVEAIKSPLNYDEKLIVAQYHGLTPDKFILCRSPYQPKELIENMDEWNTKQHGNSGLIKSVHESSISEQVAEIETLEFISKYVGNKRSPMCGNTVSHDRRFLAKYMPDLESYFHYRHIDVSSVKELISRWMNDAQTYEKEGSHRAKDDIKESINELKLYKQMLFD